MSQPILFTIGYEGATIQPFLETLRRAGVELLIDVRDLPISRKLDFSKNILSRHLEDAGISYVHMKPLGNPKAGRDAAKAGDIDRYREIFLAHMDSAPAGAATKEAAQLAEQRPACLLCLERNPLHCHRSMVAQRIAAIGGFKIENLDASAPKQGLLL